ncbi:unnamed protein product [Prorocentrum cordatum]|uniref:Transmembrane protein 107 n=1 Tax=Prorocentrum cordatum TaxID=2364126 RepID=A0ABN9YIL7_9DINO|nr:unnamed protein product [Polarella glacialis]
MATLAHVLCVAFFAAFSMALFCSRGLVTPSTCCSEGGYTWCEAQRDLRAVCSFMLGALVCCAVDVSGLRRPPVAPRRREPRSDTRWEHTKLWQRRKGLGQKDQDFFRGQSLQYSCAPWLTEIGASP